MRISYDVVSKAMRDSIIKVYKKYNGVINPSHPYTTLHIVDGPIMDSDTTFGCTSVFGRIDISLTNIYNHGLDIDPIEIYVARALEILLHEMSHCEQALDVYNLFSNLVSRDRHESENEYRTGTFMLDRLDEISNLVGYQLDKNFIKINYVDAYSKFTNFRHRNPETYPVYLNYIMLGDMKRIPRDCDLITREFGNLPIRRNGIYVPSYKLFEYYSAVYENYTPMGWRFVTPNTIALIVKPR